MSNIIKEIENKSYDINSFYKQVSSEIWKHIYGRDPNSIKYVQELLEFYKPYSDTFDHPLLHESAHQATLKYSLKHNDDITSMHERRVEIFILLWKTLGEKMFNNEDYIDKYGCTAIQRLSWNVKSLDELHPKLLNFIKNNIIAKGYNLIPMDNLNDIQDIKIILYQRKLQNNKDLKCNNNKQFIFQ